MHTGVSGPQWGCRRMHWIICVQSWLWYFQRITHSKNVTSISCLRYLKTLQKMFTLAPIFKKSCCRCRECKIFCQKATAWQGEYQIKREIDHPSPFSSLFSQSKKYTHHQPLFILHSWGGGSSGSMFAMLGLITITKKGISSIENEYSIICNTMDCCSTG